MATRIWFILGAAWFILALCWFLWRDYTLAYNFASIVCGYPNTNTPEYAACMAEKLPLARISMQHRLVVHDSLFILLPAFALVLIGALVRFRVRPAA
jgi:hypothetical protein